MRVEKAEEKADRKKRALETTFPLILTAFFLLLLAEFLESAFQASKISSFSQLSTSRQLEILADSLFLVSLPILIISLLLFLLALILTRSKRALGVLYYACSLLLSFLFFFLFFSHIDNFIYTTTGWTVYYAPLLYNIIILFLLVDMSILLVVKKGRNISNFLLAKKWVLGGAMSAILLISFMVTLHKVYVSWQETADVERAVAGDGDPVGRPNIILFASDSLDCRRMATYGYSRDTTPNINNLQNFILYTRAYTNCGNSRGSIMSMFTGKSPITTKLVFPPDILHDEDAFQHLPNILANLGYYNIDLNDGYYASTSKSSLRDGFHMENGDRTEFETGLDFQKKIRIKFSDERFFLLDLFGKHNNKLLSMMGLSSMSFDYAKFITWGEGTTLDDSERIEILKKTIREVDQPIFAHIHLMATHGPTFRPPHSKFLTGESSIMSGTAARDILARHPLDNLQLEGLPERGMKLGEDEETMEDVRRRWDLYDDATFSVDWFFGEVIQTLRETGKLENTLIIVLTDHGMGYFTPNLEDKFRHPLPLIVHLPRQHEKMVIDTPVQYLDIAPSILDFLNQPIPAWMEGDVIFKKSFDDIHIPPRSFTAVYVRQKEMVATGIKSFRVVKRELGPPHYGIDLLGLLLDNKYYIYSIQSKSGRLYDISIDPYDFRNINKPDLITKYHNLLYQQLAAKGIFIDENPFSVRVQGERNSSS